MNRQARLMLAICAAVLLPGFVAAQQWEDVVDSAIPLEYDGQRGIASAEVAEGFAAFSFTTDEAGEISIEVDVTEIRQGLEYNDDDSVLFLFDEDGYLIDDNDDGPFGFESILNGVFIGQGEYYAIVTTHPRFVELDSDGYFAGFDAPGLSSFAFDLIVSDDRIDIDEYYEDDIYGDAAVAYGLDDVLIESAPTVYSGERVSLSGWVHEGFASFEITARETAGVDIEVDVADLNGDSYLTIIDRAGTILAENDDGADNGASLVEDFPLVDGSVYYVIVTSWPNYPESDASGRLTGFSDGGYSEFEFDLVISPASTAKRPDRAVRIPDADEGATSFGEVTAAARPVIITGARGIAPGSVAAGYESFAIATDSPVDATIEVVVTEIFQGRRYEDADSLLSLFDAEGRLIASDDDGGIDGASKISNVRLATAGVYYAVVTTYPNEPVIDGDGTFEAVYADGNSFIEFDLVVRTE